MAGERGLRRGRMWRVWAECDELHAFVVFPGLRRSRFTFENGVRVWMFVFCDGLRKTKA